MKRTLNHAATRGSPTTTANFGSTVLGKTNSANANPAINDTGGCNGTNDVS